MQALMDCVVNLPNHLGQMECRYLNGYQVVGFMKRGLHVFDLTSGILREIPRESLLGRLKPLRTTLGKLMVCSEMPFGIYSELNEPLLLETSPFEDREVCYRALALTHESQRLVKALVEFQVDGDEVVKGLKALGVDVEVKVRKNYLGGWMVTSSDVYTAKENQYGVTKLIEDHVVALMKAGTESFKSDVNYEYYPLTCSSLES